MARYSSTKKFRNNLEYYDYLRHKRKLKIANHYATPVLKHPTVEERTRIITDSHIWTLGDRYYKLAHKYYGDSGYWWVIAWYNAVPVEADLLTGDMIEIPINLSSVLDVLNLDY
tara:strand:- start:26 stop:367 length:342 start_codon:yes stop_codon:yes gene_type:complete